MKELTQCPHCGMPLVDISSNTDTTQSAIPSMQDIVDWDTCRRYFKMESKKCYNISGEAYRHMIVTRMSQLDMTDIRLRLFRDMVSKIDDDRVHKSMRKVLIDIPYIIRAILRGFP